MGDLVSKIISWFGKPALLLAGVFVCSAAFLWLTELPSFAAAKKIGEPYRGWVQLTLIGSGAFLIVLGLAKSFTAIVQFVRKRSKRKHRIEALYTLTTEERQVLGAYIRRRSRTVNWPLDYGVVHSLVVRGFLYRPVNTADFRSFPHDIAPDIWEHLNDYPELVVEAGESDHEPGKRNWMSF